MDCCAPHLGAESLPFEFLALFGLGLMISLGHCIGMCGPLQGAFLMSRKRGPFALLSYHLGRLFSYGVLGALFGSLGAVLMVGGRFRFLQAGLSFFTGSLMLLLGLGLLGWLPSSRWLEQNPLSRRIAGLVSRLLSSPGSSSALILGVANGLLPCGPVYTAGLTAASTGKPLQGFLAMLFFGAGTLPLLLAFGFGGTQIIGNKRFAIFQKLSGLLVLLISLQLILRGLAAYGWVPHWRIGELVFW